MCDTVHRGVPDGVGKFSTIKRALLWWGQAVYRESVIVLVLALGTEQRQRCILKRKDWLLGRSGLPRGRQ